MSNEREAMARIQAYLNERVPVRGIDQELIHCMNDKELRVSDIVALLAARQSAGANETTLRVLSSHAIRKHEGVTIFGDPAQVLKVMAAIEAAGATGQEPVGVIERDEVNGWHMNALIDWEKIGLGTKLYAAPIDDNGAKAHEFMATRTASGPELHAALAASQPVESKRVELTEAQWRTIQAPTGNLLFDAGVHSACTRIRELLAADALYSQAERIQALEAKCAELSIALTAMANEFVKVCPVYYYSEPWAHDRNAVLKSARDVIAAQAGSKEAS